MAREEVAPPPLHSSQKLRSSHCYMGRLHTAHGTRVTHRRDLRKRAAPPPGEVIDLCDSD